MVWRLKVRVLLTGSNAAQGSGSASAILDPLKYVFSYVVLMPIAVVMTGKLLAQVPVFSLVGQEHQRFGVTIPGVLSLRASGPEAVLGFLAFLPTLTILGLAAGPAIHTVVADHLGLQIDQFTSICLFSALADVAVVAMLAGLIVGIGAARRRKDPVNVEYRQAIDDVSHNRRD